jgi:predicted DNA binding CopG/RHH family protein
MKKQKKYIRGPYAILDRKTTALYVRCSEPLFQMVKELAKKKGTDMNKLIRSLVIKDYSENIGTPPNNIN